MICLDEMEMEYWLRGWIGGSMNNEPRPCHDNSTRLSQVLHFDNYQLIVQAVDLNDKNASTSEDFSDCYGIRLNLVLVVFTFVSMNEVQQLNYFTHELCKVTLNESDQV
jgi:hypothetical protein